MDCRNDMSANGLMEHKIVTEKKESLYKLYITFINYIYTKYKSRYMIKVRLSGKHNI